jgi:hypothetical protein
MKIKSPIYQIGVELGDFEYGFSKKEERNGE